MSFEEWIECAVEDYDAGLHKSAQSAALIAIATLLSGMQEPDDDDCFMFIDRGKNSATS